MKTNTIPQQLQQAALGLLRPGTELLTVTPLPNGGMVVASADPTNSHSVYGVDVYRPATAAETDPDQTDPFPPGALIWAEGANAHDMGQVQNLMAELTAAYTPVVAAPTTPTPGELAEQRHLMDPLDHVLEHLAVERPAAVSA